MDLREKRARAAWQNPGRATSALPRSAGERLIELRAAYARCNGKILLFYCAFSERSTMAVQAAQDTGLTSARHIEGGIDAWKKVDGVLDDGSGSPLYAPAVGT